MEDDYSFLFLKKNLMKIFVCASVCVCFFFFNLENLNFLKELKILKFFFLFFLKNFEILNFFM